jgi:hypothetical protein
VIIESKNFVINYENILKGPKNQLEEAANVQSRKNLSSKVNNNNIELHFIRYLLSHTDLKK